jgi:hypothetical protein
LAGHAEWVRILWREEQPAKVCCLDPAEVCMERESAALISQNPVEAWPRRVKPDVK